MLNLLGRVSDENFSHILIVGDFNCKNINWQLNITPSDSNNFQTKIFHQILESGWYQHVNSETMFGQGQNPSLLSLAPTRRFFLASGLCLSLPNISCVGLRQVKQRNELSHLAFLMRSTASLLLKHKHVYALLSSVVHRHRNMSMLQRRFFKKKHSCGFIFSKLCHTPIFLIHIFSIK